MRISIYILPLYMLLFSFTLTTLFRLLILFRFLQFQNRINEYPTRQPAQIP